MIGYLDLGLIVVVVLLLIWAAVGAGNHMSKYLFDEKIKRYEEAMK